MHPVVLDMLIEAVSRKEDNRAKMEAANTVKRVQRLRTTVAGLHAEMAKNDAAVKWMDEWLVKQGVKFRERGGFDLLSVWKCFAQQGEILGDRALGRRPAVVPNPPVAQHLICSRIGAMLQLHSV